MSEHEGKAEVGAKLTLDDHATETLHKIKEGFEKVKEKVHEVQHEAMGFMKQAAASAIGFNLFSGIDSIKEFGHEIINANLEAKAQEKALAGVLTMTDNTGASMEELRSRAGEVREEIERMGVEMGANKDEMISAFSTVAERSKMSTEEIQIFTERMFFAGKAVSGGMNAIADGYAAVEMGNIRAGNAVVKLVTAQHLLHGNAKEVAKQMMHMTDEKRLKIAEKAIENMAAKMKPAMGADLGFKPVLAALGNIREKLFDIMGGPIVSELTKQLNRLHRYFLDNQETIEHWAHIVGEKVGEWVKEAADKIREGFEFIKAHADEIKSAIVEAWERAKSIVEWILAHKEEIALIYGAKVAGTAVGGAVGAAKDAYGLAKGLTGVAAGGIPALGIGGSGAAAGAGAGMTAALGALALVDVGVIAALGYNVKKLMDEWPDDEKEAQAKIEALRHLAATGDVATASKWKDELLVLANGKYAGEAAMLVQYTQAARDEINKIRASVDTAAANSDQPQAALDLMTMFNTAAEQHKEAQEQYIAKLIAGNAGILNSFDVVGDTFLSGGEDLIKKVDAFNHEAAEKLRKFFDQTKADHEKNAHQKAPQTNYYGGQTFNIKQDFKDQDPDRIALIFRRDIIRAAENRRQARTGTPFGV